MSNGTIGVNEAFNLESIRVRDRVRVRVRMRVRVRVGLVVL